MELKFWSLDCDIIEGPQEAGEKIATTATPEQAKSLANMLNNAWTRMGELGEIATSAHAIAARHGEGTAWDRFALRCVALGVGSVTPKTFRILPSDPQPEVTDADRLEHLDMTLRACPHAQITFDDDPHSDDGDEEKPFVMEIRGCDTFLVRGATLRDMLDASIEQLNAEKKERDDFAEDIEC